MNKMGEDNKLIDILYTSNLLSQAQRRGSGANFIITSSAISDRLYKCSEEYINMEKLRKNRDTSINDLLEDE